LIRTTDLSAEVVRHANSPQPRGHGCCDWQTLDEYIREQERRYIDETIKFNGGSREKAAKMLGISMATLYRKLESKKTRREGELEDAAHLDPGSTPRPVLVLASRQNALRNARQHERSSTLPVSLSGSSSRRDAETITRQARCRDMGNTIARHGLHFCLRTVWERDAVEDFLTRFGTAAFCAGRFAFAQISCALCAEYAVSRRIGYK